MWSQALASGLEGAGVGPWAVDVVEADDALRTAVGLTAPQVRYDGVVWTMDAAEGDDPAPAWWSALAGVAELAMAFVTVVHHAWGSFEVAPGVAQISFLRAAEGWDVPRFREAYRAHVELAREHMPSVVRYVQHDVTAVHGEGSDGVIAVSELRFATRDDVIERYWATPESPAVFRAHEPWLDRRRAWSLFSTERVTSL